MGSAEAVYFSCRFEEYLTELLSFATFQTIPRATNQPCIGHS